MVLLMAHTVVDKSLKSSDNTPAVCCFMVLLYSLFLFIIPLSIMSVMSKMLNNENQIGRKLNSFKAFKVASISFLLLMSLIFNISNITTCLKVLVTKLKDEKSQLYLHVYSFSTRQSPLDVWLSVFMWPHTLEAFEDITPSRPLSCG